MKVSSDKTFWFLIFIYSVYILIEFLFNFKLLSVSSGFSINKIEDFKTIEFVGKSLSSIGAGVFTYTLISNMTKESKNKAIITFFSMVISVLFFIYQEKIVDGFIESTDLVFRDSAESSLILKTGLINGSIVPEDYNLPKLSDSRQSLVFLSGIGLLMQGDSDTLNKIYEDKENVYPVIFKREVLNNQDKLFEEYSKNNREIYTHWYKYSDFYKDLNYDYEILIKKIKYTQLISDLEYLRSLHSRYIDDFNSYSRNRLQVANDLSIYYMDFIGCEDYNCVKNGRGKTFFKRHINKVIKGREDLYDDLFSKCTFSTSNNPKGQVYIDGKLYVSNASRIDGVNNNYHCNINSKELYSTYYSNNEAIAFDKFGIRGLKKFSSFNSFANSPDVKKIIVSKSGDYGFDMSDIDIASFNIDYQTRKSFDDSVYKVLKKTYEDAYHENMISKYGISIPLHYKNIRDFSSSKGFREIIFDETNGLVDMEDWEVDLGVDGFRERSLIVLPKKMANKFMGSNLKNDYGELITKAVVVPPVLIALSIFFGVFNLVNLFFILLSRFYYDEFGFYSFNAVRVLVYAVVLYIPASSSYGLLSDPNMVEIMSELRGSNLLFYYSFRWVVGFYYFI